MSQSTLLNTKFMVPRRGVDRLPRPHLIERLERHLSKKLTVLSAPPGYGKTTLLTELVTSAHLPYAWYQLDPTDSDPTIFLTALLEAFRRIEARITLQTDPQLGGAAQALLNNVDATTYVPPQRILTVLINELAETIEGRWLLILEDYHVITNPTIHILLDYLLENSPLGLHLCLSTRSDPPLALAKLRARGLLAEFRADDLRFTQNEVQTWLKREIPTISEQSVALLNQKTEGWGAALQIALSSLQGKDSVSANRFINGISGTHRFIFEYLAEEVFTRLTPDRQQFLMRTAILERMNAQACHALLDNAANAQLTLEGMEQDNMFLVSLDEQRQWYRYHHLFREFLLGRLQREDPHQLVNLHQRAGDYFTGLGEMEPAFNHYLQGYQFDSAARALAAFAPEYIERGHFAVLQRYFNDLPDSAARNQPRLLLYHGDVLRRLGQVGSAVTRYENARSAFETGGDQAGLCHALTRLSELARSQGDYQRARALAQQALDYKTDDDFVGQARALMALAKSEGFLEGMDRGRSLAEASIAALNRAGDEVSARIRANLLRSMGEICWWHGDPQATVRYCQEALHSLSDELSPITANAYITMATPYLYWRDLETAQQYAEKGLDMAQKLQLAELLSRAYTTLGNVLTRRGETARAENCLRQAVNLAQGLGLETYARVMATGFLAYNLCGQGRADEARQLVESVLWSQANHPDTYEVYVCRSVLADVALESNQLVEAQQLFEGLVETGERRKFQIPLAMVYFGLAYIHLKAGSKEEGLRLAKQSLERLKSTGALQLYLDQGERAYLVCEALLDSGVKSPFISQVLENLPGTPRPITIVPGDDKTISVQCLGPFRVFQSHTEITRERWVSARARDLLAYFVTFRHERIPLDVVMEAFWPERPAQSKAAFHTTMSRLRQALRAEGKSTKYILVETGEYWLDAARFQIDVDDFDTAITKAQSTGGKESIEWYEHALSLYKGEYLGNLLYHDWVLPERRRLTEAYFSALQHLAARRAAAGQYEEALKLVRRVLQKDPLREDCHCDAMRYCASLENRAGVVRQYQQLTRTLNDELGVEPLPSTQQLYQALLTAR